MASMKPDEEQRFRNRYRTSSTDPLVEAEIEVLGSDYRANGYTTKAQADELGKVLRLGRGDLLLDLGSGCGWPGLYLGATLGCRVVGVDPISDGSGVAAARARTDRLRYAAVSSLGEALAFRPGSFDAVVHTDVTC